MKKHFLIIFVFASLLLTGCFGSNGNSQDADKKIPGFTLRSTDEWSIQAPDGWEILSPNDLNSDLPKNTLLAIRSNIRNPKFTANVVILKNTTAEGTQTIDYAKALRQRVKDGLTAYNEINAEETKIFIGDAETTTMFWHAQGRETPDADLKDFMQISAVKGANAYLATGAMLAEEDQATAKKIETMVRSFRVK